MAEPGPPIDPDGNPYRRLIQQHYSHDPWKQTVCCILLNRTRRCVLDRIRHRLFRAFPNPAAMAAADPERLARIWAIFVDGRRDVAPTDLKLIWWLAERA